jgi:hypothetical protein
MLRCSGGRVSSAAAAMGPRVGWVTIAVTVLEASSSQLGRGWGGRLRLAICRPWSRRRARRGPRVLAAMCWSTWPMAAWMELRSSGKGRSKLVWAGLWLE